MTIVVLIILATISINAIFGEDGVIKQADIAKVQMKQAEYEEKTKLVVSGEYLGKKIENSTEPLKELSRTALGEEEWVRNVEDIEDKENQLKVITTDNYMVIVEIMEDGSVNVISVEPYDGKPSISLEQLELEGTENERIKIKVTAWIEKTIDRNNKIEKIELENTGEIKGYQEDGVIFEVESNGRYTFKATTDRGDYIRKSIAINVVEPDSNIEIISEPTEPRNTTSTGTQNGIAKGQITVTINYGETDFKKQYKKEGDSTWTEVTGTSTTFTVTENIAIYARYYDTKNGGLKSVTYNIQNVDNVAPNAFNATETHTTNSITVGASTTDTASNGAASTIAGILRYEYRIYKNSAWQGWQTSNNFTGLPTGSYQIQAKAIDKAGNEKVSTNTLNVTLGTVSTADISITSTPTTARNTGTTGTQNGIAKGPISVTITYGNSSYTRQYKKSTDSTWTSVTGTSTTFTVTDNIAIYARYFDGTNGFQTSAYNIQNVDNVAPNAFNATETHTTNSITVGASTTDTASSGAASTTAGILRYEYRIYKNSAWQGWQTSNNFTGLPTGSYQVQAKAIDKAGNEKVSTNTLNVTLGTVSTADISITSTPTTARNTGTTGTQNGIAKGPISVTITYGNSSYTRQYKKSTDSTWTSVTGISTTFTVTDNIAIYARYFDGTNGFQTSAYNIQNVDNVAPTFSTYNATVSGATITASGTATDTATTGAASTIPGILRYEYSNGGTTYQTSNKFTVSSAGTYTIYIKAIDKAGNQTIVNKQVTVNSYTVTYNANGGSGAPAAQTAISGVNLTLSTTVPTRTGYSFLGWSTSSTATSATYAKGATYTANTTVTLYAVWKLDNTAPTAPTTSVTARDTSSFTVNAKSTDSNGDSLTYKLYAKTSTGSYALAATSASTASGTAVNLKASSLSGYTVYNYYVTVTDGKATTTGTTGTTGTACNGTGLTCTGPFSTTSTCTSATRCTGPFTTTKTCTSATRCTGPFTATCSSAVSTQVVCGTYSSIGITGLKCQRCGKTYSATHTGNCSCGASTFVNTGWIYKCGTCGTTTTSTTVYTNYQHKVTRYVCSTHGYTGTSQSHTYAINCSHGNSSAHYYCSTHSYNGSSSSHTYSAATTCSHGNSSSHYYCSTHGYNGNSSSHTYSYATPCTHGKSSSHSYCTHGKTLTHYPN